MTAPVKEAQLTTVTLSEDAERRLAIKTETVAQRAVPRTRTIGGEIMAPSGTALAITAPVAGTLQATAAVPTAGLSVLRGQTLFRLVPIQPSERDAAVDAQQAVDTTTARRDAAALKVQRAERLVKDGSVSRRALEEAQAELAVAEAELKAARERVALATRSGTSSGGVAHRGAGGGHRAERARARRPDGGRGHAAHRPGASRHGVGARSGLRWRGERPSTRAPPPTCSRSARRLMPPA